MTIIRLSDRLAKLEQQLGPSVPRGLVEAEARLIALTNAIGGAGEDQEQLLTLLGLALAQVRARGGDGPQHGPLCR